MKSIVIALPQTALPIEIEKPPLGKRISEFLRQYGAILLLIALLLGGMVTGAVRTTADPARPLGTADRFFISMPQTNAGKTPVMIFADTFSVSFIFAAALCFFALTPSGLPAVPAVIFFRGFEYGVFVGRLCVEYGFKGLGYFLTVIFAGAFLSSLSLIYYSQYCLQCSLFMLLAIFGHVDTGAYSLRSRFRELALNGAYSLLALVFASLTDTLLFFLIGRCFTFY